VTTYIGTGIDSVAFVTDSTGVFSLASGVPVVELQLPAQALLAGLVSDSDSFPAPSIAAIAGLATLLPALVADTDAVYAPSVLGQAALLPALVTDADAIYAPSSAAIGNLSPNLITDTDAVYGPAVRGVATLLPALVVDAETFYTQAIGGTLAAFLLPPLQVDSDSVFSPSVVAGSVTLSPAQVTDGDAIYVATVGIDRFLRPALVNDTEAVPGAYSIVAAAPGKDQKLHAARLFSDDVFFSPKFSICPLLVVDVDSIFAASTLPVYPIRPPFMASDDVIPSIAVSPSLPAAFLPSDDAIYRPGITLFLLPQLRTSDDAIPAADVGWKVFAQFVGDVEQIPSVFVQAYNKLLPATWFDEEHVDDYPFFVHGLTGGIPVPRPPNVLIGSVSNARRLTGSVSKRKQLTGSIVSSRRVLTGSLRQR
jgi:hypothetical protein